MGRHGEPWGYGVENARSLYFWRKAGTRGNNCSRKLRGQPEGRETKELAAFNIFIFTERSWENIETAAL